MLVRIALVAATSAPVFAGMAGPAEATVPGENGQIAFASFSNRLDELTLRETVTRSIDVASPSGRGRHSLHSCTRVVGENGVQLAPDLGDCSIEYGSPAWSPDGRRLAFDAGTRLVVMRSDGTDFRLLAQQTANDGEPAWSPDGRRLVFTGARGAEADSGTDLYILDLRSGNLRPLTFRGGRDHAPAWSSRDRIAFTRGGEPLAPGSGTFRPGSGNIFTVRLDSRGLRQLTYRNGSDPAWSPHASKLVFVRGRRRSGGWAYSLFTVAADGRGLRSVRTPGADDPADPSWSPDGKRIAYSAFNGCVSTQRLDGRDVRQVASCGLGGSYNFGGSAPSWQRAR